MEKPKTTGEYFTHDGSSDKFASHLSAIESVYKYFLSNNVNGVTIKRITTHTPCIGLLGKTVTETVSGELFVEGPANLARSSELSRFHFDIEKLF